VTLRRWRTDDASAVFAACQDSLIARFTPIPQPYTEEHARSFVERGRECWTAHGECLFAIVGATSGEFLGAMTRHEPRRHRVEFGYWLAPAARGRAVASRALRLIADWTLAATHLVRLELWTDADNDAPGRVAEQAGFSREGVLRAWAVDRDGQPSDAVFYSRVRG
jgi:RimJ/RimL family protein N-acetyltransferase